MTRVLVWVTGALFALSAIGTVAIFATVKTYSIPSESMVPTLPVGSRVWVTRWRPVVQRRDVVVYDAPGPTGQLIKRVVAVGGDAVSAQDGHLVVNGAVIDEPELEPGTITDHLEPTEVPPGQLYVLGDNRTNSKDSRYVGPIPEESVIGTVALRKAPPAITWLILPGILGLVFLACWRADRRARAAR